MPQAMIYLNDEENDKIEELAKKWNLSKMDVIKKIIEEYKVG